MVTGPSRGAAAFFLVAMTILSAGPLAAEAAGKETPIAIITLPGQNDLFIPGDVVQLDGRRSFDPDGSVANYSWATGDGGALFGAQAVHAYESPGEYNLTLTVTDGDGQNASATVRIFVKLALVIPLEIKPAQPSSGAFQEGAGIALSPFEGLRVPFGPKNDRAYLWDFGDGRTSTDREPKHSFANPGTYNITLTVFEGDAAARTTLQVKVYPATAPSNNWLYTMFAASILLVVGFAVFFGGTELGLLTLGPLFILLYSRIKQDHILDNYTRGQIHGYIIANPGEHYSSIKAALDLNNGTLAYHLQRLENESVIKSAMDGAHRRYYPVGMKVPEPKADALTEVQRMIISKITETPGISQRDIGALMGLSSATVNYHIERLLAKGVMHRERAGMRYRCFVNETVPGTRPPQDN